MLDRWFPHVAFPVPIETFHQLPRNAAYKYEYWDGAAHLSGRPKFYHCLLPLARRETPEVVVADGERPVRFRRLAETDWPALPDVFASAFRDVPPFGQIVREQRIEAARECLERTRSGGDGPLIDDASFVAYATGDERIVGGLLVTLSHDGDLEDFHGDAWKENIPEDALARRWGRPHLTWVFVSFRYERFGIATALLVHAADALWKLGYRELASTFLLGNESSVLWHWRNGFRLLSWPGSPRMIRRRIDAERTKDGVE